MYQFLFVTATDVEETLPEISERDDRPEIGGIVTEKDGKNENPNESEDEGDTAKRYPRRTQRSTLLEDTGLPPLIANMGWGGKQIMVTIRIEGGSLQMSNPSLVGRSPRLGGRGGRGRGGRGREYISFRFVCSYHSNGLRFADFIWLVAHCKDSILLSVVLRILFLYQADVEEAGEGVAGVMAVGEAEKSSLLLCNHSWAMMATSSTAICAGMWAMSYAVTDAQTFIIPPVSLQV